MGDFSDIDGIYMQRALELAREGLGRVWPNPSVGCVIVKDGVIIGGARTQDGGRPHAEELVLEQLGERARGATAYVTLEPCNHDRDPKPCAQNLIDAGVYRVVVACLDPDPRTAGQGIRRLRDAGIEVVTGVCEQEAIEINRGFFKHKKLGIPFVTLKQAVSADGMIASRDDNGVGVRTQISGKEAHQYLHELRSSYDAIAVGVNTVIADDPMLTTRLGGVDHHIVRVVFDGALRIPIEGKLVQSARNEPLWVCFQSASQDRQDELTALGVRLLQTNGSVQSGVAALGAFGITRLLVEGGAKLHGAFMRAGLVDELQILRSSIELGSQAVKGADFANFGFVSCERRQLGEDSLEVYRLAA